jgi:hypothetical protein
MTVMHARGWRKNLALTAWLMLPIAVVAGLVVWIFAAYRAGPVMDARPIGQGAGDTGGANALGEWLAGRNPDEVARVRRALREGRLVDPLDWAAGVVLLFRGPEGDLPGASIVVWDGAGTETLRAIPIEARERGGEMDLAESPASRFARLSRETIAWAYAGGRDGAGVYLSRDGSAMIAGGVPVDASGAPLPRLRLPLIPREQVLEGEAIEIEADAGPG